MTRGATNERAEGSVHGIARSVADTTWGDIGARIGLAARGVVFLGLGYLVAQIALGALGEPSTSEPANAPGVAQALAEQSGGRVMLFVLAVGLVLYALLALLDAVRSHDGEQSAARRWGTRAISVGGLVGYGAFAVYCLRAALSNDGGGQTASQSEQRPTQWSARVLEWPAGQLWLGLLGFALLAVAVAMVVHGVRAGFRDNLKREEMSPRMWRCAVAVGRTGDFGRAALFGLVGWFILAAAVENDPSKGKGVDGSARALAASSAGPYLLWALAAAVGAYGVYMFIEARYRTV